MTNDTTHRHHDSAVETGEHDRGLTAREREVLELVGAGLRGEEMADRLGIAESTVATLLRSSMAKLDARTRVEAAAKLARAADERTRMHANRRTTAAPKQKGVRH